MLDFNLKLQSAAAGLGAAILVGGCAMMEPKAERYVAPPLGTTWESARHDSGSYGSGSTKVPGRRGERMWQGEQILTFDGTGGTVFAKQNGNWIGIFKEDTPIMTWDPPLGWEWPLEVGKTWSREQRMTIHATKRTIAYQATQRVEAIEDVTVPAGTFRTLKMSTVTSLGDENLTWYSPELGVFVKQSLKRTGMHPQGAGTRELELLSYKRGAQ